LANRALSGEARSARGGGDPWGSGVACLVLVRADPVGLVDHELPDVVVIEERRPGPGRREGGGETNPGHGRVGGARGGRCRLATAAIGRTGALEATGRRWAHPRGHRPLSSGRREARLGPNERTVTKRPGNRCVRAPWSSPRPAPRRGPRGRPIGPRRAVAFTGRARARQSCSSSRASRASRAGPWSRLCLSSLLLQHAADPATAKCLDAGGQSGDLSAWGPSPGPQGPDPASRMDAMGPYKINARPRSARRDGDDI